jgi:glycosyltransferase involved in cell wall biosynthesis
MLSILHLDTGMELRGGQWQILALAQGLRSRGHQQVVACPQGSLLFERARVSGLDTFALPSSGAWSRRSIGLLRRLIREQTFQIIHAHDGRGQTLAWEASVGLPVKRVASRRVAFLSNRLLHRLKYSLTCHGIIAVSAFVRELLVASGVPAEKIAIIPDGVDIPETVTSTTERACLRSQWQVGLQDFVVGHVGAFTAEKGQDVAVRAVELLAGTLPHVVVLLAGDGPRREVLERQCAARGVRSVRFVGYVRDLDSFFNCLDLFAMPSRAEGLGSSALMAMAHGLPVVASRTGGLAEIIESERTGWLVQPGSPTALAEAIVHACAARERLVMMGQAAREKARSFSSDVLTANTEAFYDQLLKLGQRKADH